VTIDLNGELLTLPCCQFNGYKIFLNSDSGILALVNYPKDDLTKAKIVVGNAFPSLPYLLQQFLIYHEIGHIKCNHQLNSGTSLHEYFKDRIFNPELNQNEIVADRYAADQMGVHNAIEALEILTKISK
jgi:hypothetical protein